MTASRPAYPTRITVVGDRIEVRAPYALRDALFAAGGRWEPTVKAWGFPATPAYAFTIKGIVAQAQTTPEFDALLLGEGGLRPFSSGISGYDIQQRYTLDAPEIPGLVGSSWMHQRRAYAAAMSRDATMLALGLGAGKSRVAIGCIINRDVHRVLVLAPKSVVAVWPAEFEKHHAFGQVEVLPLVDGSVASKTVIATRTLSLGRNRKVVVVTNYDAARCEPFRSWSLEAGFDMVVLDESQRVKSAGGVTSRYVAALGKRAKYRLALSGTPAAHSPLDLYGQYRFLDPSIFAPDVLPCRENPHGDEHEYVEASELLR